MVSLHRSEHLPAQLWNWLCLCMICFWMKVADTRTRPGVSPLCCSPQQACCSDSSRTKRYLIEPLFSVTGCLTYSFITFIKRKHCFQELQRVFNFYRMTVFSPVMTCMCLDLHCMGALELVSVSVQPGQVLCQIWTKQHCESDCHVL